MKPVDITIEQQIIIGMIVSTDFLREIKNIIKPESLTLSYARPIVNWCIEYYEKYEQAPEKHIKDLYLKNSKTLYDPAEGKLIEKFLTKLDNDYKQAKDFNIEFVLDQAEQYIRLKALDKLKEELADTITGNRVDDGESLIADFVRPARPKTKGIDPIGDVNYIISSLEDKDKDIVFQFPGVLGELTGPFERGFLMGIVAQYKVGKSWWLQQLAMEAVFNSCNVLFISFEMSEKQMMKRIQSNLAAKPVKKKHIGEVLVPVFDCGLNQTDQCQRKRRTSEIGLLIEGKKPKIKQELIKDRNKITFIPRIDNDYSPCLACMGRSWYDFSTWFEIQDKELLNTNDIKQGGNISKFMFKGKQIKLVQFPSGTRLSEIETYIDNLMYYEGFYPDVMITDYADKMTANDKRVNYLRQEREIWEWHKYFAQKYHCFVATANQSNTVREGKNISQGDWAGDIGKLGLIDIGWAINQKPQEKRDGYSRVFIMAHRHDDFDVLGEVYVLQCFRIGKPFLDSFYLK